MFPDGMFVRDGKVIFKQVSNTCEAGNHIFSKGGAKPCDCGAHANFYVADSEGLSQEPVLVKKHLGLIQGGKK